MPKPEGPGGAGLKASRAARVSRASLYSSTWCLRVITTLECPAWYVAASTPTVRAMVVAFDFAESLERYPGVPDSVGCFAPRFADDVRIADGSGNDGKTRSRGIVAAALA
jgi:hypothetical protein